jgi:sulfite exporter TauE/SafE
MQVVALSSGSISTGALVMLAFALGTLPVLALVSFGSLNLAKSVYRGMFLKTAGILVVLFALVMIQNALAVFGVISPVSIF